MIGLESIWARILAFFRFKLVDSHPWELINIFGQKQLYVVIQIHEFWTTIEKQKPLLEDN